MFAAGLNLLRNALVPGQEFVYQQDQKWSIIT